MRGRFCLMVSIMLLAGLTPLMTPQASADSELSPQGEHLVGDFTWIRGLNGTLFMAKNTTGLHVIDVSNMSVIQSVNCASGWRWADGTRVSVDETRLICGDPDDSVQEVYALSNTGLTLIHTFNGSEDTTYPRDITSLRSIHRYGGRCVGQGQSSSSFVTIKDINGTMIGNNISLSYNAVSEMAYIRNMFLDENDTNMLNIIFETDDSLGCPNDVDVDYTIRHATYNITTTSTIYFDEDVGDELSCERMVDFKIFQTGLVSSWSELQQGNCDNADYISMNSSYSVSQSIKDYFDSADSEDGIYYSSLCNMMYEEDTTSAANPAYIYLNETKYEIPFSYSFIGLESPACTSNKNVTFLIDGDIHVLWDDGDGDGVNDLDDAFPNDATQTEDTDGDGFGDSFSGFQADACVNQPGTSFHDRFGCPDMDTDGWSDQSDSFPNQASQWNDTDGDGYGDNSTGWQGDSCTGVYGDSNRDRFGCPDDDLDGWSNEADAFDSDSSQWNDTDSDGWGDNGVGQNPDGCPSIHGTSTEDRLGCPDTDGDGWSDAGDALPSDSTQWKDTDGDGYGDNQTAGATNVDVFPLDGTQWADTDGDGFGDNEGGNYGDSCPSVGGNSTIDRNGCIDGDGDGVSDLNDAFPDDPNAWQDTDGDDVEDSEDQYPFDPTQWADSDGDGYGDNPYGLKGDACNQTFGNSSKDVYGCPDSDGDGWSDDGDAFPNDAASWLDTDGDGVEDGVDAYPFDPSQALDSDNDTYGDDINGVRGDSCPTIWGNSSMDRYGCVDTDGDGWSDLNDGFPDDVSRHADTDKDGVEDEYDDFPYDPTQTTDSDGDGMGDNPMGIGADKFPDDVTQWSDIDGDGYGDNQTGNNSDAFPTDTTQWADQDGDGFGDNPAGNLYDLFLNDSTQWADSDGDGLGDNQSGNNPDPFLNDHDNDGYNDSVDLFPDEATQWADDDKDGLGDNTSGVFGDPSPGDRDNDGVLDPDDAFPLDPKDWVDYDGDGVGDNSDPDDDDDGVLDIVEIQEGTDPFNSGSKPVEGFEIILPGTNVALGAWDLLGVFAGIPLGLWLCFAFLTRGTRTKRYERELLAAQSSVELREIASQFERSLMMRAIGPHQGMRLERLRGDIEDNFRQMQEQAQNPSLDAMLEPKKNIPPPPAVMNGTVNLGGMEWLDHEGVKWYRKAYSGAEWNKWQ